MRTPTRLMCALVALLTPLAASPSRAQPTPPAKVEISWDRYYDTAQTIDLMRRIASAYPELVTLKTLGKSIQGRDMLLAVVSAPGVPDTAKPAIWIDGNVHGNEVQACEVVLYTLWYLTRDYGRNEQITALLTNYTFYLLPTVNPDGRQYWFDHASTAHSSRQNQRPQDDDRDGLVDEDGPDDLDGDGQITQMWKADAAGRWVRSQTDERIFVRLRDDQTPTPGVETWTALGDEGIDNDGDGRINEDGPFGDDMNRNWPSDWQPEYVQPGAGPYPLSSPETAAIASFMLDHPNIAAVQSYHNAGGMILRGPGAAYRERMFPPEDLRVYDELGRTGEQILPYYRYMILFSQLYRVHGGFVNWGSEGLGAYSFTNELWSAAKYFQRDNTNPGEEQQWLWRDRVAFGELFSKLKPFDHPQFGKILVGGLNKWSSRVTPTFMLQDECHRNFAFTMFHADQMPVLEFRRVEATPVQVGGAGGGGVGGGGALWRVRAELTNTRLMPTRSALAQHERIGPPDLIECTGGSVVAANRFNDWLDQTPEAVPREPGRVVIPEGIPGRTTRVFEFIVEGNEAAGEQGRVTIRYTSAWARTIERVVELKSPNRP